MGFKKKKSSGPDISDLQRQRDQAIGDLTNYGNKGIDTLESSKQWYNPQLSQSLFNKALGQFDTFDQDATARADESYKANYLPILNEVKANLGNQFAGMGSAGRNNSRGQFAQAALSRDLADRSGQQLLGIREQARQRQMAEIQDLYNPMAGIMQQLQGVDTSKANALSQLGQALANTRIGSATNIAQLQQQNANLQAQQKNASKSGIGSAIGGGLSLAGSLFSDERLKENIKFLKVLDNGIRLYTYNIKGSDIPQIGVLAQETQLYKPQAVKLDKSGYLKVDYKELVK